ncbi:MAG TPA: glycosyltransferase family 4 protein, partial [Terriglobia bacterium]|nr:glycosyltransferase family 4 protein [Terriglobia bacterium]
MSKEDTVQNAQLNAYRHQVEQLETRLKEVRNDLAADRAKIETLNHAIADLNEQIAIMADGVTTANSTISSMASSLSWRATVPIRKLKRLYLKSVRPLQDRFGGITRTKYTISQDKDKSAASDGERDGFDPVFYLKTYPEVRTLYSKDPFEHFINHGKREGRLGSLPSVRNSGDFARLDPKRDTVLVVSHEATATGAPVLSLNIILELKKKYNVVSLVLRGGSIVDDFKAVADIAAGPVYGHGQRVFLNPIKALLATCNFKFAIVNSAVSRIVLPLLTKNSIPSVALIHEFAASIRPRNAIAETVFWASEAIFSADIVKNDAIAAVPELSIPHSAVIPQGKCLHFPKTMEESTEFAAEQIRRTFRPPGWPEGTRVVLGVGSIQMRKGIDLFVACAARVTKLLRCRFVWIGAGFDPDIDNSYSVYLQDQVSRAGLTECFAFMDETSNIEFAYENATVLVLSSRLDPLPNVCIDAMSRGLPFVCFDRTTGFAEILKQNGLEKECVAPYLDVDALASCVFRFLEDSELRGSVGNRLREIANRNFSMTSYVAQLEDIALSWVDRVAQESADCATIAVSPLLDVAYFVGPDRPGTSRE